MVMSVRYARRISVDVATEDTPSAAYRSGSPESVEARAAGIVAEAVSCETSGRVKRHAGCADEGCADAAVGGGSVADGGRRVESRACSRPREVRGVACGACVEVTRASDASTRRRRGEREARKREANRRDSTLSIRSG